MRADTPVVAGGSKNDRRVASTHAHVCAMLLLASLVCFAAAGKVTDADLRMSPAMFVASGTLALESALGPWVIPGFPVFQQRTGIWMALGLALVPSSALLASVGLTGLLACNLLLIAAVLSEQSKRPRVISWLWIATIAASGLTLLHLVRPLV